MNNNEESYERFLCTQPQPLRNTQHLRGECFVSNDCYLSISSCARDVRIFQILSCFLRQGESCLQ